MRVKLLCGQFGWDYILKADNGKEVYCQTDWDYPSIAGNFGFVPCEHGCGTDGTINCSHHTAGEMINAAHEFLDDHINDDFEDPGYFED
jgi:hypothetical protein